MNKDKLVELEQRIADLETWANEFSCNQLDGHPIFETRARRAEVDRQLADHRAAALRSHAPK